MDVAAWPRTPGPDLGDTDRVHISLTTGGDIRIPRGARAPIVSSVTS
jgi:hypothetical protein